MRKNPLFSGFMDGARIKYKSKKFIDAKPSQAKKTKD